MAVQGLDDIIYLDDQAYPTSGVVRANAISEFESGVKVGKANYDNREGANFVVIDDFSGGMGYRRDDIRDGAGTYWTPVGAAPDLRRPGHFTLSGAQDSQALSNFTNFNAGTRGPSMPACRITNNRYVFGWANNIYYFASAAAAPTLAYTSGTGATGAGQCEAIIETSKPNGGSRYYAAFSYYDYPAGLTGSARYVSSSDGITWANGSADKVISDMIWWDNKIIAAWGNQIIFGVVSNAGEAWNIDDVNDAEPIATINSGPIHFIGVADAAWGQPSVYFTDERDLFVLDFYNRAAYKIDLGTGTSANDGCIYQGTVTTTDGWNVEQFNPGSGGGSIKNIGLPRNDGIPDSLTSASAADFRIRKLIPAGAYLFAVVSGYSTPGVVGGTWTTFLMCYNGTGWHQVGESQSGFSNFGFLVRFPLNEISITAYPNATQRFIYMPHAAVAGNVIATSTATALTRWYLPSVNMVPGYGVDHYSGRNDGVYGNINSQGWMGGWMDMGFRELDGALLRVDVDGYNLTSTETLMIEYRLNNDEAGAFTQLVNENGVPAVFDGTAAPLYFAGTVPVHGIQFRTVQFRYTLTRGTNTLHTPEVKAIVVTFIKKPQFRAEYKVKIDIDRMVERTETSADQTFMVNGLPASNENVWAKLWATWNKHTLVPLVIPGLEPNGIAVMMTDMPIAIDDFRQFLSGQAAMSGDIELTLQEVIPSHGVNDAGNNGATVGSTAFDVATSAAFNFPLNDPQTTLYSANGLGTLLIDLPNVIDHLYNQSVGYVGVTWDSMFLILTTKMTDPSDQRIIRMTSIGNVDLDVSLYIPADANSGTALAAEADTSGNIFVIWKHNNSTPLALRKYTSAGVFVSSVSFGGAINTASRGYSAQLGVGAASPANVYILANNYPHNVIYIFSNMTLSSTNSVSWDNGPGIDVDEFGHVYTTRYARRALDNDINAVYVDRRDAGLTILSTITMDVAATIADIAYGHNEIFVDYRNNISVYAAGN